MSKLRTKAVKLARNFAQDPTAAAKAATHALRTEAAMRLLHVAGVIAPKGTATEAEGGDATGDGEMVGGRPNARLLVVTHDPIAGAMLTMGIAKVMTQQLSDLRDLAWMYADPAAADPFA